MEKSGLKPGHTLPTWVRQCTRALSRPMAQTTQAEEHTQAYSGLRSGYTLPTQVRQCTRVLSGSGPQTADRGKEHTGIHSQRAAEYLGETPTKTVSHTRLYHAQQN